MAIHRRGGRQFEIRKQSWRDPDVIHNRPLKQRMRSSGNARVVVLLILFVILLIVSKFVIE